MGYRHAGYQKVPCPYCGKLISYNNMIGKHYPKCVKAQEAFRAARMEMLMTKPVQCLNLGEAEESGRYEEFKAYIHNLHNNS
jgi:hypothetical protein